MIIENSKTYNVNEVESLFFRPSFCGKKAEELGIRVLYNMPVPTRVPSFSHNFDVLHNFASGWQGGCSCEWEEKEIMLKKLKAESSYSAESYFSSIYELLLCSTDINLGDLTGTDLEKAETELFRRAIVESIYATMWFGDENCDISNLNGFNGFMRQIINYVELDNPEAPIMIEDNAVDTTAIDILRNLWTMSSPALRDLAAEGNLVYFVTPDIYDAYRFWLEDCGLTSPIADPANPRPTLIYHGIPVEQIPIGQYGLSKPMSFGILTDRRNLILALNTADSPEKEIHMWYNPDEMENRQRVVFLAGTAIADNNLISAHIFNAGVNL
jgi:hypothetical protein